MTAANMYKTSANWVLLLIMNTLSLNLLNKIKECSGGGYAVLSLEELSECAPADEPVSFDDISQAITELAEQKYIDIKYSRGNMYCVTALKDYVLDEGEIIPEVVSAEREVDSGKLYAICAALSFAGAFLGSFIVCIIFSAVG